MARREARSQIIMARSISTCNVIRHYQSDQIGRFLKVLANKISQSFCDLLRYSENITLKVKTNAATFGKFCLPNILTSGHTGHYVVLPNCKLWVKQILNIKLKV